MRTRSALWDLPKRGADTKTWHAGFSRWPRRWAGAIFRGYWPGGPCFPPYTANVVLASLGLGANSACRMESPPDTSAPDRPQLPRERLDCGPRDNRPRGI